MAYTLIIGEKNYSSWSLRAWLLMRHLGLPFEEITVNLYLENSRSVMRGLGGETGIVPVLKDGDFVIWDTLAIFEFLHERHGGVWPRDARHRARARSWCGEIHSGFNALRNAMPVNTRARGVAAERTPEVEEDIARAVAIWATAGRERGPWLFGEFSCADVMFAPIATRFQTYGVELAGKSKAYLDQLLGHPLMVEWLALAAAETNVIPRWER